MSQYNSTDSLETVLTSLRTRTGRMLWLEPCWLVLLGPLVLFPGRWLSPAWQPWVILSLFLFPALRLPLAPTRLALHSPLTITVLLILLWLPVNLWAAPDPERAWGAVGYLVYGIAWYGALVRWPPARRQPAWVAGLLLLAGSGLALIAPPFVVWKPDFRLFRLPLYDRLVNLHIPLGEDIHANVLAGTLVIVIPLLFALLLAFESLEINRGPHPLRLKSGGKDKPLLRRVVNVLLILLFLYIVGLLVLTQSRGGYLGLGVGLALVLLLRWPRLWWLALPAVILAVLGVGQFGLSSILDQLSTDGTLGGWQSRLEVWSASYTAIGDFAFTGIGIGGFASVLPLLYPLPFDVVAFPHAHNLFLQVALDLGIPGLVAFLALLINLWVMALSLLRMPYLCSLHRALTMGATGGLAALLVHGLLDATTWGLKLAFAPWLLYALITLLFLHAHDTMPVDAPLPLSSSTPEDCQ